MITFMSKISKFLSIFLLITLFGSCGSDLSRKDKVAAMVGTMDSPFFAAAFVPENLSTKAGVNDGALPMIYETMISFLFSEEATGIDINEQVQVVAARGEGMLPSVYAFVPLNNVNKFITLVKKELNAKIEEKDGVSYFRKDKDNYVVAWRDDIAIISNVPVRLENIFSKSSLDSKKAAIRLVKLLNGDFKESTTTNYRDFFDKEGDIITYAHGQNTFNILNDLKFIRARQKREIQALLSGLTFESAITFENGSIRIKGDYFLSDSIRKKFDFIQEGGLNADMLTFGRTESPMFTYGLNISPASLIQFMNENGELIEFDDLEKELSRNNLSLEMIEEAFTGQALIMADGFETIANNYNEDSVSVPAIAAVFDLKNETKINEFLNLLDSTEHPNGYAVYNDTYFYVKEGKLLVTNSLKWAEMIERGETKKIEDPSDRMTTFPVNFFLNNKFFIELKEELDELTGNEFTKNIEEIWATATLTNGETRLLLKDKEKNALRMIVETLVEASERQNMHNDEEMKAFLRDFETKDIEEILDGLEPELKKIKEESGIEQKLEDLGPEKAKSLFEDILEELESEADLSN